MIELLICFVLGGGLTAAGVFIDYAVTGRWLSFGSPE